MGQRWGAHQVAPAQCVVSQSILIALYLPHKKGGIRLLFNLVERLFNAQSSFHLVNSARYQPCP